MNAEQKKSHAQLIEALYDVCLETFDVLKQEAGLLKRYGKLRLFLLPYCINQRSVIRTGNRFSAYYADPPNHCYAPMK